MNLFRSASIVLAALPIVIAPLLAGGFYLELGSPSANKDPKAKGAVLVARLTGCHEPAKGTLEGTAEGFVNGKRETVQLKTIALSEPGMYAVARQWPAEGKWVVHLTATHPTHKVPTSMLVRVNGDSFERKDAKFAMRALTPAEVQSMLD